MEAAARRKDFGATAVALLSKCHLFAGFSEDEIRLLLPKMEPLMQTYEKGEVIAKINEPARFLWLVLAGIVLEHRPDSHNEPHILGRHRQNALLGLEACFSKPRTSHVEYNAATDCKLLRFNFRALLPPDRLTENLSETLSDESVKKTFKLSVLGEASLREQLMAYFHAMRDKHHSDTFPIKMNQTEMAEYFNAGRSYFSHELNNMKKEGILETLPDGSYHIMKWKTSPPNRETQQRKKSEKVNRE